MQGYQHGTLILGPTLLEVLKWDPNVGRFRVFWMGYVTFNLGATFSGFYEWIMGSLGGARIAAVRSKIVFS